MYNVFINNLISLEEAMEKLWGKCFKNYIFN